MANKLSQPKTLQEAIVYFSDPEAGLRLCGQSPLARTAHHLPALQRNRAFVPAHSPDVVLQGMQAAVLCEGWNHL